VSIQKQQSPSRLTAAATGASLSHPVAKRDTIRCTQSIASSAILLRGLAIQFSETDQARPSHSALPTTSPSRRVQHPGEGRASYRCQRCASRVLLPLFPLPSEPARATRSSGAALSSNAGRRCQLRVGHPVRPNPGLMMYHFSPRERRVAPRAAGGIPHPRRSRTGVPVAFQRKSSGATKGRRIV